MRKQLTPADATCLGMPVALLDVFSCDTRDPEFFRKEVERQRRRIGYSVLQLHPSFGPVEQFDTNTPGYLPELLCAACDIVGRGDEFCLLAVEKVMALEELRSAYYDVHADTVLSIEKLNYRSRVPGVNELQHAIEAGVARERVKLEFIVHRRREVASVVAELVAEKNHADYPELPRIRAAGVELLDQIDGILGGGRGGPAAEDCGDVRVFTSADE